VLLHIIFGLDAVLSVMVPLEVQQAVCIMHSNMTCRSAISEKKWANKANPLQKILVHGKTNCRLKMPWAAHRVLFQRTKKIEEPLLAQIQTLLDH
jgi:hypothetical protein